MDESESKLVESEQETWHIPTKSKTWYCSDLPERFRFGRYRDACCEAFMALSPEVDIDEPFSAHIETIPLHEGALNRVFVSPHKVYRSRSDIAKSVDRCYYMILQLAGASRISQLGAEVLNKKGNVTIIDSSEPFLLDHDPRLNQGVASFLVPIDIINQFTKEEISFSGKLLSDHPNIGKLLVSTLSILQAKASSISEKESTTLFNTALQLAALAASYYGQESSVSDSILQNARYEVLSEFLNQHLRDSHLSVGLIASHFGISKRTIHKIFEPNGRSFTREMMERRLNGVFTELSSGSAKKKKISDVAFAWGFNDLSHFNRIFKARYGLTPREITMGD